MKLAAATLALLLVPAAPALADADLRMVTAPLVPGREVEHVDEPFVWVLRAFNVGSEPARDVTLTDILPADTAARLVEPDGAAFSIRPVTPERPDGDANRQIRGPAAAAACGFTQPLPGRPLLFRGAGELTCRIGDLAPGHVAVLELELTSPRPGRRENRARVAAGTPDAAPGNEEAVAAVEFVDDRSSIDTGALRRFGRARQGTISGRASPGAGRVELALARRTGSDCLWLRNARGRITRGRCDAPRWLRVRGTERWSYRIGRRLPRGRYVAYSRATTRGASEGRFSAALRNRYAFRLR